MSAADAIAATAAGAVSLPSELYGSGEFEDSAAIDMILDAVGDLRVKLRVSFGCVLLVLCCVYVKLCVY